MNDLTMTLGRALDGGYHLFVNCAWGKRLGMKSIRECLGSAELDVETLVWTKGRDFPIYRLKSNRLRCPRCRSLRVRLRIEAPRPWEYAAMRRRG